MSGAQPLKQARSKAPQDFKTTPVKPVEKSKKIKNDEPRAVGIEILKTAVKIALLLIWVVAAVIVSQLVVGYVMLWLIGEEAFEQTVPMAIYSALSYVLAFAWLLFATPKISIKFKLKNGQKASKISPQKIDREELGLKGVPTWTDIGLAPVGYVVATIAAAGLVAVFNMFPWFDAAQAQDVGFAPYLIGAEKVIAFVVLVVVAPVAEELIFRGWLYGKLRTMLSVKMSDVGSMLISILLVSVLFGMVHMQWNVGVNVFALSVVLCGLREITGTIYAGILTHMLKNGVAFYLLYVL